MSPHIQQCYDDKNDGQLPTESELINSFAQHSTDDESRAMRVSPFQVESILGIRNDKPIDLEANLGDANSVDSQERSNVLSPQEMVQPGHENNVYGVSENNTKLSLHPLPSSPPTEVVDSFPEPHTEQGDVLQVCACEIFNPRRACAVTVTVVGSACQCVCYCFNSLLDCLFFSQTI